MMARGSGRGICLVLVGWGGAHPRGSHTVWAWGRDQTKLRKGSLFFYVSSVLPPLLPLRARESRQTAPPYPSFCQLVPLLPHLPSLFHCSLCLIFSQRPQIAIEFLTPASSLSSPVDPATAWFPFPHTYKRERDQSRQFTSFISWIGSIRSATPFPFARQSSFDLPPSLSVSSIASFSLC